MLAIEEKNEELNQVKGQVNRTKEDYTSPNVRPDNFLEDPLQLSDEALRKKYYRHRTVLQGLLPSNSMDSLKMMIYCVNLSTLHGRLQIELKKIQIDSGDLNIQQIRYRVD